MKVDTHHVVGWKQFCATCRADGSSFCSPETRTIFNRFYARYRLAAHFEAVHAHGYSEKALHGYTAGLRLLAAYSAAELLGEAIGSNVTSWKIPDSALAAALRKVLLRPSADSTGLFAQEGLRKKLQLFMDGDIDIRIPATALRVMVAHGSFTPTGTDSLTKAGAEALQRLSDVLLHECERRFGAWLHEMLAKRDEAA